MGQTTWGLLSYLIQGSHNYWGRRYPGSRVLYGSIRRTLKHFCLLIDEWRESGVDQGIHLSLWLYAYFDCGAPGRWLCDQRKQRSLDFWPIPHSPRFLVPLLRRPENKKFKYGDQGYHRQSCTCLRRCSLNFPEFSSDDSPLHCSFPSRHYSLVHHHLSVAVLLAQWSAAGSSIWDDEPGLRLLPQWRVQFIHWRVQLSSLLSSSQV